MNAIHYFAEALGRERALTDDEVRLLASAQARQRAEAIAKRWSAREDRQLIAMARQGIHAITAARKLGRTPDAIRSRKRQLKRKGKV